MWIYLGLLNMTKYVYNVKAPVVKQFAPHIYIAQYNASLELGIIMGLNPSWILNQIAQLSILFGGAMQKGSSVAPPPLLLLSLEVILIKSEQRLGPSGLNLRLFKHYFMQEHSKSTSGLTHSSIQCFVILGYCGWDQIPLSFCNCKNKVLAKKRILFNSDASANLWKNQLHWVFS